MNKTTLIIFGLVAVAALGAGVWYLTSYAPGPTTFAPIPLVTVPASADKDTTAEITQELGSVDLGSIDEGLSAVDADINGL